MGTDVFTEANHGLPLEGPGTGSTQAQGAAAAAQASVRFLRDAMNALVAHLAVLDETGSIILTNDAWDKFTLESRGVTGRLGLGVGSNYLDACDAAEGELRYPAAQITQAIRAILQGGSEPLIVEYPCHTPTQQRWFYCRIARLPREGPAHVVVTHVNISPTREIKAALQASEARFRSTFELAAVGIVHTRSDGSLVQVNREFCNIVGYSSEELLHIPIHELTHPEDLAHDRVQKDLLFRGEISSYTLEKRYRRKNAESVWVSVTGSLIRDAAGEPDCMVAIVENIHLRKLTALALHTLNTNSNGVAFLQRVTQTLATLLGVEFAFVTEMTHASKHQVKTRALWADDGFAPDFSFDLRGSACEAAMGEASPLFDEDTESEPLIVAGQARQRFPGDERLGRLGIQAYAGVALWSAGGAPLGTLAVMSRQPLRDAQAATALLQLLSMRVGSELEREHENRKFHELFDNSPSAILMLDTQGTIHLVNRACEEFFGWKAQALLGQVVGMLFPDAQQEEYMKLYSAFVASGLTDPTKSVPQDILAQRQDGSIFPTELYLSRLDTAFGSMTVAYVHDITERKRVQDRQQQLNQELEAKVLERTREIEAVNRLLANKEEEIRSVVENMVDVVIGLSEDGIIISANAAITKILGYNAQEVLGRNVSMLMPEPHHSAHNGYIQNYHRTGQARVIGIGREVQGLHKNGELIDLELSVGEYAVRGKRFFSGTLHDIRDRVRMMKTLEHARNEAEQANRAKSDFLAAMSHEIRTPMNGVIGMIDVLEQSSLSGDQIETVQTIRDSSHALLTIIDDVLDFSKIEAGQFRIDCEPLNLIQVVEAVCDTLHPLALKKGVELTLFAAPDMPPWLLGDAVRIRQVLVNLVGNAIKFSSGLGRPGRVRLRVGLTTQAASPATVVFEVIDNGIGLNPQAISRLFSPFTQADSSTTRRFGGTGLGLSISRRLVDMMGGVISVQSTPDQGSTFTVRLPLVAAPEAPDAAVGAEALDVAGLVCLVQGGPDTLAADLAVYLAHGGASVTQVPDLARAKAWMERRAPQMCVWVIDVQGQLTEELRLAYRVPSQPEIRLVIIERGLRRRPRLRAPDLATLDGDAMHRQAFLRAVALAAGRITEEVRKEPGTAPGTPAPLLALAALAQGKAILIAEDNEINQKVVLKQLALLGLSADVAGDGRAALERWRSGNYAFLLTDLHMPHMDGYELTRAIRAAESGRQRMPIVALTANALKGEAQNCRNVGMDDYLTKPVQLADLKATLSKWLSATPPPSSPPAPPAQLAATTPAPPGAAPSAPVVEVNVLKALVGDDPGDIQEFLQAFRLSAASTATELNAAWQAGQLKDAAALAHKLKSSSRTVGALALGELCAHLEAAGDKGQRAEFEQLLPRFHAESRAVEAFLLALDS